MKKLCALISVIMMCVFGTTAFAATTDAKIVLTPDKNSVAVGDTITITVGVTGDSAGQALYGTAKVKLTWDTSYFEYVSGEVDSTTFSLKNATTFAQNDNTATFGQKVVNTETRPTGAQTFGTLTLKAIAPGSSAITLHSDTAVYVNKGTKLANRAAMDATATAAITITSPSTGGSVNATQSGSTFTDAADAKAVAYVAELDSSASGKTGRWYATIGTTPMKTVKTFTLPNISAEKVKLGLVYKGAETISNVAFKWE